MRLSHAALLALSLFACGEQASTPADPAPAAPPATTEGRIPAPGDTTGTVLETMNAGEYTYLRLQTSGGEVWAAVPQTATAVGATVTLLNPMPMQDFTSPTLHRTFPTILFATLDDGGAPAAPAAPVAAPAEAAPIAVEKASGADARTVAEVWSQRAALKDQKVTVRGQVVKANNGVMGKNWLHLHDGTGSAASKDDDLTVTSAATAAVGETVTVTGVVHTDKDFGAGYTYAVILEEATLAK